MIRRRTAQVCAVALILATWYGVVRQAPRASENARLADRFAFQQAALNAATGPRTVRPVNPALRSIDQWISSVGAAVALADLDGNGLPDDSCLVDPRDDSVTVSPVPGTGARYPVFRLVPVGLPYDATMAPMGCAPGDYNEDGATDVLVYYWGRSPVLFLRTQRRPAGPAAFAAQEVVRPYQVWNTNALTVADVDGDGHADLVVGNYFADGAGILDTHASHQAQTHMHKSMSNARNGGGDRVLLYRGGRGGDHPDASFADVPHAFPASIGKGWTLAVGAQDLDGSGLPDIYVGNDFGPDWLLRNTSTPGHVRFQVMRGMRHFTTPKSRVLGRDSFKGMGVAFSDINGDDVPDILVSNIAENFALQESNFAWLSTARRPLSTDGTARYDDHSESLGLARSGWGWDIKGGDFAGDGRIEVLQATGFLTGHTNRWPELQELAMTNDDLIKGPGRWPAFPPGTDISGRDHVHFYVRGDAGRFHDVARPLGVADTGVSRAIALADVTHDGRLDFAVANQWRQSYFYRNTRDTTHPYLGLSMLRAAGGCGASAGTGTTPAVGAEVRVGTGAAGVRTGQVYPAGGHGGVSAPELLFALKDGTTAVPVTVTWRDACGVRHSADERLAPGWHRLRLDANGSAEEVTS